MISAISEIKLQNAFEDILTFDRLVQSLNCLCLKLQTSSTKVTVSSHCLRNYKTKNDCSGDLSIIIEVDFMTTTITEQC